MINYVNNAYDKVLKPCDAQRFSIITNSQETERLIALHRSGDARAKQNLSALTYMGVLDKEKYKGYLAKCEAQGTKPQGSRRADFMRPTGLLMLDFDHVQNQTQPPNGPTPSLPVREGEQPSPQIDSPIKLWEYIKGKMSAMSESSPSGGVEVALSSIALAHITPSGDGLRLVVKRTKGTTIEQEQYEWCKAMKLDAIGIKPDAACKDISRLSFAPMQSEVLYYNPSLLFGELPPQEDYPDGSLWGGVSSRDGVILSSAKDLAQGLCQGTLRDCLNGDLKVVSHSLGMTETNGTLYDTKVAEQYPTDYDGIEYSSIVSRLEEQLGGRPEHGARNSFIFTMACNLRYVCNDDAQWIAQILPTYGEDAQKHRMTIQSAVNRPMSRTMPDTMKRALGVAKVCADNGQQTTDNSQGAPPSLPATLPPLMDLLTSRTPEKMRAAVAMSVFPPLGAHLQGVKVTYWDGRDYEPTFMQVLAAEMSAGKSAVNLPIEYIKADIKARDEVALGRMREWKAKCNTLKTTEDKPERPKGHAIQLLPADITDTNNVPYIKIITIFAA